MSGPATKPDANRDYYYSSGRKIPLRPDTQLVAVDLSKSGPRTEVAREAVPLSDSLLLMNKNGLTGTKAADLEKLTSIPGATYDVFTADGAKLVVLPEVRVEVENAAQDKRMKQLLRDRKDIKVQEQDGQYNLFVATSRDALDLANEIWETAKPAAAHPRFVRITKRPDTRG